MTHPSLMKFGVKIHMVLPFARRGQWANSTPWLCNDATVRNAGCPGSANPTRWPGMMVTVSAGPGTPIGIHVIGLDHDPLWAEMYGIASTGAATTRISNPSTVAVNHGADANPPARRARNCPVMTCPPVGVHGPSARTVTTHRCASFCSCNHPPRVPLEVN
jgi:hypothetical protein